MARIDIPEGDEKERQAGVDTWYSEMRWTLDGSQLLVSYALADTHRDWHLYAVEPGKEDTPAEICSAHLEPWADWQNLTPSPDSKHAYFSGYRNGWRRICRVPVAGGEIEEITGDGLDVTGFFIPKNGERIFYTANAPDPREQQVFTLPLNGGSPTRISPILTNSAVVTSDDGSSVALISSGVMTPPELYVLKRNNPVKVTSSPLSGFSKITEPKIERFSFKNESDGKTIYGRMMLPHNFDSSKKYPVVLTCVYAGQAKEGFGRYHLLDAYMANEMGYILVSVDFRASIGYGSDFFYGYYKSLGIIDAGECVSCAKYMQSLPYVDGDRIGIWGGSYGGFLVLMCMCSYPGVFHTGVSWKPVTDWRNYWDGYTAVRLDRPEADPDIYKATSPVFHADKLEGNLLVVHGMLDDNVLFQDAVWMIQKLIESGKYFDLMIYPRDDHGLTRRHESLPDCMERFAAYFEEHMGLGPV
jgi:dipeptidyl-peptidase 4